MTAINLLSRVTVLSCRKIQNDFIIRTTHRDEAFASALKDTEGILDGSIRKTDRFYGMFNMFTKLKMYQVHRFLIGFGSAKRAGDFALKRAESMLSETSGCRTLGHPDILVVEESIMLFAQHDCTRPVCEKILLTFLRHLQTQSSSQSVDSTTQATWAPLELSHATLVQSPPLERFEGPIKAIKHNAICDECDKVWFPLPTSVSSLTEC